jgi:hypothetical protein
LTVIARGRLSPLGWRLALRILDTEKIKLRIAELQLEHRGLDALIESISMQGQYDELQMRRLKKRKLQIKDMIVLLQMQLVPDIPA